VKVETKVMEIKENKLGLSCAKLRLSCASLLTGTELGKNANLKMKEKP
jgi:hypothetical protein